MRHNQTEAEGKLWQVLRTHCLNDIHFRRQHAIGPYIVDFCVPSVKLIIELDGGQHLDQQDGCCAAYLELKGYRVLCFWNNEMMDNLDGIISVILEQVE